LKGKKSTLWGGEGEIKKATRRNGERGVSSYRKGAFNKNNKNKGKRGGGGRRPQKREIRQSRVQRGKVLYRPIKRVNQTGVLIEDQGGKKPISVKHNMNG